MPILLSVTHTRLTPSLTPHGRLVLTTSDDAPELEAALAQRLLDAFEHGSGHGLLHLGGAEVGQPLPPVFGYWRELGVRYVTTLCTRPGADTHHTPIPPPDTADLQTLALGAPAMPGAEYVSAHVRETLWREIDTRGGGAGGSRWMGRHGRQNTVRR